jgi:hypothetical protein
MKSLLIVAAAAALLGASVPASAQVVVGAGEHGVRVRVGDSHHHGWRHRHRDAYGYAHCRTVRSKTVTGHGRVIYKTRRICN